MLDIYLIVYITNIYRNVGFFLFIFLIWFEWIWYKTKAVIPVRWSPKNASACQINIAPEVQFLVFIISKPDMADDGNKEKKKI